MYWWQQRAFRERRYKIRRSNPSCRTGRKTKNLLLVRILQKTHFPPYRLEHTQSLFLRNIRLSEFEGKYPEFILTSISYLSFVYFLKILVMKLSKLKSVGCGSTHNHSGRLLAVASSTLPRCMPLSGSHINLHNIMYIVKPSESRMLNEK